MTRVKICGVTSEADREAAVAAGADAVGVLVDVPVDSPREIAADHAADLVAGLPPFVTSVLVTMPDSMEGAFSLRQRVGADAIQVHGTLSPAQVGELHERTDADVVVATAPDEASAYAPLADAVLVDSLDQSEAGGTGETHDWEVSRDLVTDLSVPVMLAGGLTPDNVREAVERVDPYAVDTASGVEQTGGKKDHEAVRSFVTRARGAEA